MPGHEPGHAAPAGFSWEDYVAWLVAQHGSLTAVAERLSSLRGYEDDVYSIERALRRLRTRGQRDGGTWGARALAAFGLPDALTERARWMGAYHSRFTDLPLPLAQDLLRLWDRPPVSEEPTSHVFLALAHATCVLRADDRDAARTHLARIRPLLGKAPPEARIEALLTEAFVASREDVARVPGLLEEIEPLFELSMPAHDKACLFARWIDQCAFERNRSWGGKQPDPAAAEALYQRIPEDGPAFARARRANGLAYARWKQGFLEEGAALAREACRHAGDGGHMRMRAMALNMLARIVGGEEGADAKRRAMAIANELEDEVLRLRFERRGGSKGSKAEG
ncbi:hypothetical protein [Polyangium sorediatum]|uniref:DUF4034 domain-containing protein n=1 Tax=Polyangium sorediatum TaxID=889274 RepID=A0ABT6P4V6_9BACT|nr:hypothetical protein [Polyangium sorediatum]MDI1435659.1 hypothetical protein [Polyangium sorediatum]